MVDKRLLNDVALFMLIAIVAWSLAFFTGGVIDHVEFTQQVPQLSQVVSSQSAQDPLVVLTVTPGVVAKGENTIISWSVSRDVAVSCNGSSLPADASWDGVREFSQGAHFWVSDRLEENTTYAIECSDFQGRRSISNMQVIVR